MLGWAEEHIRGLLFYSCQGAAERPTLVGSFAARAARAAGDFRRAPGGLKSSAPVPLSAAVSSADLECKRVCLCVFLVICCNKSKKKRRQKKHAFLKSVERV